MNRKQFGILLVFLVVLGGAGWYLQSNRNRDEGAGEQGTGQKLLGDAFPVNDVTQISIREGTNELNLIKRNDLWRVNERKDYPASFSGISEFLLKIRDLKVVQNEQVGPSQLARLQLAPAGQGTNSGIAVDFKDKDGKSIRSLTLGKKLMSKAQPQRQFQFGGEMADGRYVMLAGNSGHALLIADPLDKIQPKPEDWLDKDFFKIERPRAIAVTFQVASNSWKIDRDTDSGDWKLTDAKGDEKLDAARASGVSSPFASPSFNDVIPPGPKPEDNGMGKPTTVTVETFDDFTYVVKVGAKDGQNYPITLSVTANFPKERAPIKDEKPAEKAMAEKAWETREKQLQDKLKETKRFENWTYLVPAWNVDPILKERKDLLAEKKDETKPADKAGAASTKPEPLADPADVSPLALPDKLDAK